MKTIQIIPKNNKKTAQAILNDYLTELSQFDPDIKFDTNGVPIYKWFNAYWTEKERFPLYFMVDGNVAGMALIREIDDCVYEVAEFYVKPQFRKDGNAILFANQVINLFCGKFLISTRHTNPRAVNFWSKFVEQFVLVKCTEDDIWKYWEVTK